MIITKILCLLYPSAIENGCFNSSSWNFYSNGSCYNEANSYQTYDNYDSAKAVCNDLHPDAHIVVINTHQENLFVGDIASGSDIWLGCSDDEVEGTWVCVDGSGNTYDYETGNATGYWGKNY